MPTKLSINLNKVATVRNTRHLGLPSVVRAAQLCIAAGVHGITVHPRPDERHIRADDVTDLAALLNNHPSVEFNIEGNPFHNVLPFVEAVRPVQTTFVPDSADQFTSNQGWDLNDLNSPLCVQLREAIAQAKTSGARVSLFMNPEPRLMAAAKTLGADRVELYTEPYAKAYAAAFGDAPQSLQGTTAAQAQFESVLAYYVASSRAAHAVGLAVNAGHDLNCANLPALLKACHAAHAPIAEVSIGHAFVADSLELGYAEASRRYLAAVAD